MQYVVNYVTYASIVLLFALAFFFQYRMFRFFDLSAGVAFLSGAYAFVTLVQFGQDEMNSILIAALFSVILALTLTELFVRRLSNWGAPPLDLTLFSFGAYIVGVNLMSLLFGDEVYRPVGLEISNSVALLGGVITGAQIYLTSCATMAFVAIGLMLSFSPQGRIFRALSNNPKLARDLGLPVTPTILLATATGAALAGAGGALITADVGVRPTTAFPFMLPGLAAVLAFGGRTLSNVFWGATIVAVTGETGVLLLGQQWREFAIFAVVALFLVLRTQLARMRS